MRLAVVNLKGGTSKTTTALHLAAGLARRGPTLLVDADPQGSALAWTEAADELPFPSVALPVKDLHRRLGQLADPYRHVVIDTPPGDVGIVSSALRAADLALLTLRPSISDVRRVPAVLELVEDVRAVNDRLVLRVLITQTRWGTRSRDAVRAELAGAGLSVLDAEVPLRESLVWADGDVLEDAGLYGPVLDELLDIEQTVVTVGRGSV